MQRFRKVSDMLRSVGGVRFLLPFVIVACIANAEGPTAAQQSDHARRIAHVRHNDISFSVNIDATNNRSLAILASARIETNGPNLPKPVIVKLRLRDESVIEGMAQPQPSAGSGGYVDRRYRFDAKRDLTLDNIFSVTITLAGESFEVYPW